MISDRQFSDLHGKLASQGGFSADARTGEEPTDGGMVAMRNSPERQIGSGVSLPSDIKDFHQNNPSAMNQPGAHIGGWRNKADGNDYLDASQRIGGNPAVAAESGHEVANADAITSAADIGIARGEKAVFAVGRGKDKNGKDVQAWGNTRPPR